MTDDPMRAFRHVYWPGPNINDHTFVRHRDQWHLFHIWLPKGTPPDVADEWAKRGVDLDNVIGHAVSEDLRHWRTEPDILPKLPKPAWEWAPGANAPHAFEWQGTFYLYYSRYDHHQHIGVATSPDLYNWTRHPENPIFHPAAFWCPWADAGSPQFRPYCCRDPHVIRAGGEFLLYYVAMTRRRRISAVGCAASQDLIHWEDRGPVATMPVADTGTGMCESPCVFEHEGRWRLFFTHGEGTHWAVSDSPFHFEEPRFLAPAHAAEVFDWNGDFFITHCWHGGLDMARLDLSRSEPKILPF